MGKNKENMVIMKHLKNQAETDVVVPEQGLSTGAANQKVSDPADTTSAACGIGAIPICSQISVSTSSEVHGGSKCFTY